MSGKKTTTGELLQALADRLDTETILELFPQSEPEEIRELLRNTAAESSDSCNIAVNEKEMPEITPRAPLPGRLILFSDGASRGNPGQAGAGFVVVDAHGREIVASGKYLGTCTNNVAEYKALLLGLHEAGRFGRKLDVKLDSELIVRQLQGRYKVRDAKLKPLFDQVRQALTQFDDYTVQHVPRHENKRADQLANAAIDNTFNNKI